MKRIGSFFAAVFTVGTMLLPTEHALAETQTDNLLLNPSFENYVETEDGFIPSDWVDEIGCWGCQNKNTLSSDQYEAIDEDYYCWPCITSKYPEGKGASAGQTISIYQDVDITGYNEQTVFELSGLIFNYNQSPHDESILTLSFLDADGKCIDELSRAQRNPEVNRVTVSTAKPANADTIRVVCTAKGYVGYDVDGYFDDLNLVVKDSKAVNLVIFGDAGAEAGKSTTLTAYNGSSSKPGKYTWTSSYEAYATVDEKGKVTFTSDYNAAEGVSVYAVDKQTGITAEFRFGSEAVNEQDNILKKAADFKASKKEKTSVTLKWTRNKKAAGYYVQQYNAGEKKWETIKTMKKNNTVTCKVSSLKSKTTYKFRVVSYAKFGSYELKVPSKAISVKTK